MSGQDDMDALRRRIDGFRSIQQHLSRAMSVELTSPDGAVTVRVEAGSQYSITTDPERAAMLDRAEIETIVLNTHNTTHERLHEQLLSCLPTLLTPSRLDGGAAS